MTEYLFARTIDFGSNITLSGSVVGTMPTLNTTAAYLQLVNSNTAGAYGAQIQFGSVPGSPYAVIGTRLVDGTSPGSGRLEFAIKDTSASSLVNRLTLKNGGQLLSSSAFDTYDFGGRYSIGAYNNFGYQAFIGYSQTSDLNPVGTNSQRTYGGYFFADNNYVLTGSENPAAGGAYMEGRATNGALATGAEIDAQNTSGANPRDIDPNHIFGTTSAAVPIGLLLAAGGSKDTGASAGTGKAASAAIAVVKSDPAAIYGQNFYKGFVFQAGSIVGNGDGHFEFLSVPASYEMVWYSSGGVKGSLSSSSATDALIWNNAGSAAQFELSTGSTPRATFYADNTQSILASLTNIPLLIKTNNTTIGTFSTGGAFTLINPTGGLGYGTGAGGTVTQGTSKTTGVTLDKINGEIVLNASSLNDSTNAGFLLTNSTIAANDHVHVEVKTGGTADAYAIWTSKVSAGSCRIVVRNVSGGTLAESFTLGFAVIRGSVS